MYRPSEDSAEMRYVQTRRATLGGHLPRRCRSASEPPKLPAMSTYGDFAFELNERGMSKTSRSSGFCRIC
ncbi:hypothetical protein BZM26_34335 [Paraburkholderia strydomiana]|nr:hypothetical protein BZM26_34335 [Paraburkholderia strydomiana]